MIFRESEADYADVRVKHRKLRAEGLPGPPKYVE